MDEIIISESDLNRLIFDMSPKIKEFMLQKDRYYKIPEFYLFLIGAFSSYLKYEKGVKITYV